jgi:hypothetical protein
MVSFNDVTETDGLGGQRGWPRVLAAAYIWTMYAGSNAQVDEPSTKRN